MRSFPAFPARLFGFLSRLMLAVAMIASTASFAQSDEADPPSRVGRVSETYGEVYIAPDEPDADWQPVGVNYPVTVGDNIWSGHDSRAEIDFGSGHVRLSRETNIHFSQLDDRQFSAYLASGRAILRLRALEPGEVAKFDTANMQVDILRPGVYRIEGDPDGNSSVLVVREGEAQLRTSDNVVTVSTGQTATVSGTGYGSALVVREGFTTDGFDSWSMDRDYRLETDGASSQYVSPEVPGVRDLDYYGTWDVAPTYGAVWYPTSVGVDWVPYRDGSWTFVRPWGWTWVDRSPWGWVPFHYGRWVRVGTRWGWCPGEYVRRPVYAPALVAWYGGPGGTNWSVSVGSPAFGWVPLAWGEPYWPHYRHSTNYWRIINRPYAVNVNRVPSKPLPTFAFANGRYGAFTAAPAEALAQRRPINTTRITLPPAALAGAALTTGPLNVRPLTKPPLAIDRPRGAPPPASTFLGRQRIDREAGRNPGDGRPPVRPGLGNEIGRPGTVSEPRRPGIVTEPPRPGAVIEPQRPALGPEPMRPGAVGETMRPGVMGEPPRSGVTPEPGRPGIATEPARRGIAPEPPRPGVSAEPPRQGGLVPPQRARPETGATPMTPPSQGGQPYQPGAAAPPSYPPVGVPPGGARPHNQAPSMEGQPYQPGAGRPMPPVRVAPAEGGAPQFQRPLPQPAPITPAPRAAPSIPVPVMPAPPMPAPAMPSPQPHSMPQSLPQPYVPPAAARPVPAPAAAPPPIPVPAVPAQPAPPQSVRPEPAPSDRPQGR
jgi:hypothetical protein